MNLWVITIGFCRIPSDTVPANWIVGTLLNWWVSEEAVETYEIFTSSVLLPVYFITRVLSPLPALHSLKCLPLLAACCLLPLTIDQRMYVPLCLATRQHKASVCIINERAGLDWTLGYCVSSRSEIHIYIFCLSMFVFTMINIDCISFVTSLSKKCVTL